MKKLFLISFFIVCAAISASAQVDTSLMKQDSVPANKKETINTPSSLPPANRAFGLELSPLRLFTGATVQDFKTQISGTVTLFSIDRRGELAFPFVFMVGNLDGVPAKIINFDVTYRRYFKKQQKGFYYAAGIRYNYLQGAVSIEDHSNTHAHTDEQLTQNRTGIFLGIGYRHFFKNGWYWGTSISMGVYLRKMNPRLYIGNEGPPPDPLAAWDIGKIGYAF